MAALTVVLAVAGLPGIAWAEVPNPTVEGPILGGVKGRPWNSTIYELSTPAHDYREAEYFHSGTATNLANGRTAEYKSRFLVRMPKDPAAFNGIVLFDWMNVTNGQDWEYNWWPPAHEYLMREGYGYVAVTAQNVGAQHLRTWDPQRYATLTHPGDDYSFDIYSQAIEAVRDPANNVVSTLYPRGVDPTEGLDTRFVVAGGVSQSASRLTTFINDGYDRGTIDAYNIERGGGPFEDRSKFVFHLNEETGFTGSAGSVKPPDDEKYVFWEEAGTAHHPRVWWDYTFRTMQRDQFVSGIPDPVNTGCSVNQGRVDYSVRAMLHHTRAYLETGAVPPSAPRIERTEDGDVARDQDGLVRGGLRHPFVEVPVALNRATTDDCINWGHYEAWSAEKIVARYPTHCDYLRKVRAWAEHEVSRGWLLAGDRDDAVAEARAFTAPWKGVACPEPPAAGGASPAPATVSAPACDATTGLTSVSVAPAARSGVRLGFARASDAPVRIDVFRVSDGRRVVRERLVARFQDRTAPVEWDGRATRGGALRRVGDGYYVVRFSMVRGGQLLDVRRVVLRRTAGRFSRRADHHRRASCDLVRGFKLERPVFGGLRSAPLRISYRLAAAAKVTITVSRGSTVVRRLTARAAAGRTHRLQLRSRGLRRGDHRVRLRAEGSGTPVEVTLGARRL